ncbi:hypothetical protein GCM10010387_65380 [Streptomyces inusitatus]|uniref:Resolvase/invertase-type recombinase catalytic domain-containing protein n=1 Tax=Streptomyces inusitatus TaxID=68221 RepID=A0A918QND6_9ACTN|nr:DUF6415 family natural product biosynthesis protein [Streptomyces inusitatus]GGZ62931.1 hypothetical protein GCM10010387_65380 [Streptomyces inusitatus]
MTNEQATPAGEPGVATHAFIYDRHATLAGGLLEERLDHCRQYAERRGWTIAGTWVDLGDNALSFHHRPLLDGLCTAMGLASGPAVCLIHDWDRLNREGEYRIALRHRVLEVGGHTETTAGESDAAETRPLNARRPQARSQDVEQPLDLPTMQGNARRLLVSGGELPENELAALTELLRGHVELLIGEVAQRVERSAPEDPAVLVARVGLNEARRRFITPPGFGPDASYQHARRLARSTFSLTNHYQNLAHG